ncbi:MAG: pitrilysin family protein [Balneolaceae bacterium]
MKRLLLFTLLMVLSISVTAQKRYDEIKYPKLNSFEKAKVEEFKLDNGITFYLVEDKELPLIRVNAIVRTGNLLDPESKTGLASMVGQVMREGGSKSYPSEKLNILLEDKAASMSVYIGEGSGNASMSILKEDFDVLLPAFVDLVQNPLFPEDKIELYKTQAKSGISRRNDDQSQIASREFNKLIYGEDSPYALQEEYETIDAITRDDLVQFHKQAFVGNNLMLGVIGDFDTKAMKNKLKKAFGNLPAGSKTNLIYPEVNYTYPSTISLIDKSDVNQSYVLIGHIGGLRDNPDYASIQMMNQVLGGSFSGRLFQKVRSDLGLAYAVGGSYGSGMNYPSTFTLYVMTKSSTTAEAIDAILVEVKRIQDEPVTAKELNDARDRFLNSLVFKFDSKNKILTERLNNEYYGLSQDTFDKYVEDLKKVTIADIQRVAKEYLRPDKVQVLVVGNKAEIGDQLNKFGKINEIDIAIPEPASDADEVAGDKVQGKQWLKKMSEAIIKPGTKVTSITTVATVTQVTPMGNMDLKNTSTINFEVNSIESSIDSPQGVIGLSVANGQGKMSMMGQEQPLPPAMVGPMVKEIKNSYLNIARTYSNLDVEYMGTEKVEGTEYVVIKVVNDGAITFLLDSKTALPYLSRTSGFNPQAGKSIVEENTYTEWKAVGSVNYAHSTVTSADGSKAAETKIESLKVN